VEGGALQRFSTAPPKSKENPVHKIVRLTGLATLLALSLTSGFAAPPSSASSQGTLVIVFKDGHQQSFNLADIARVEFPGAVQAGSLNTSGPSRAHFIGKWEVGEGNGNNFYITLKESGDAERSLRGDVHGKWVYVDGEARVTWDDGPQDAIRKVGSRFEKFAYAPGKSFTDTPDNVTNARNLTPKPI
jgi:hypothetical protein